MTIRITHETNVTHTVKVDVSPTTGYAAQGATENEALRKLVSYLADDLAKSIRNEVPSLNPSQTNAIWRVLKTKDLRKWNSRTAYWESYINAELNALVNDIEKAVKDNV